MGEGRLSEGRRVNRTSASLERDGVLAILEFEILALLKDLGRTGQDSTNQREDDDRAAHLAKTRMK